ncbi:unnamed protein product [Parnassius mnemosyne]
MFLKGKNIPRSTVDGGLQSNEENGVTKNRSDSENTLTLIETENTVTVNKTTGTLFATPKPFRKRRLPVEKDTTQQEAVKILQNMYENRKSRDESDAFGEYVSMKLNQIKNSYARNTAQHHVNNILCNVSIGQYDFPTNPTASSSWGYNSELNHPLFWKIMLSVVSQLHLKLVLRIAPGCILHILVLAQEHRVRLIYRNQAKIRPNH